MEELIFARGQFNTRQQHSLAWSDLSSSSPRLSIVLSGDASCLGDVTKGSQAVSVKPNLIPEVNKKFKTEIEQLGKLLGHAIPYHIEFPVYFGGDGDRSIASLVFHNANDYFSLRLSYFDHIRQNRNVAIDAEGNWDIYRQTLNRMIEAQTETSMKMMQDAISSSTCAASPTLSLGSNDRQGFKLVTALRIAIVTSNQLASIQAGRNEGVKCFHSQFVLMVGDDGTYIVPRDPTEIMRLLSSSDVAVYNFVMKNSIETHSAANPVTIAFRHVTRPLTDDPQVKEWSSSPELVASHYNLMQGASIKSRRLLQSFIQKNFNNFMKSTMLDMLINKHDRAQSHGVVLNPNTLGTVKKVLDLAGGKGGDMRKLERTTVTNWTMVDIAGDSVNDARDRYNNVAGRESNRLFGANLVVADLGATRMKPLYDNMVCDGVIGVHYDLAMCQFAMHYFFQTENRSRMFLCNVSDGLKIGGYFVASIPNAAHIVQRLRLEIRNSVSQPGSARPVRWGNSLYDIVFPHADTKLAPFGSSYIFSLSEAVNDCEEYLVHMEVLKNLGAEYGLELVFYSNFHDWFNVAITYDDMVKLALSMEALDKGQLPQDEWEVAGLYMFVVMRKIREPSPESVMRLVDECPVSIPGQIPLRNSFSIVPEDAIIHVKR